MRVQIRQGLAQNGPIAGILCVFQVPDHAGAGHKDALFLAKQVERNLGEDFSTSNGVTVLGHVDLCLDRLTFPTSGHVFIVPFGGANVKCGTCLEGTQTGAMV